MEEKKHHPFINLFTFILFFIIFIIHYTDIIDISIKKATPMILLPLITAFAIFNSSRTSAAVGLITGMCMDGALGGTLCFNTLIIMLIAVFVSVLSNSLFNRNINSAILISVLTGLLYFLLRWIFFYAFKATAADNLTYLLSYAFPSLLYTNFFIFPFYFLFKYFDKIKTQ